MQVATKHSKSFGRALGLLSVLTVFAGAPLYAQEEPRFEETPSGDGILDTQTGLVWGHHFREVDQFLSGQSVSRGWDFTMDMWVLFDDETDDFITYQMFSDTEYGPVAGPEGIWRVPSRDELVNAVDAGLMLHLDISPANGVQLYNPDAPQFNPLVWSSTPGGKKRGGFNSAYVVNLLTGDSTNITVGSSIGGTIAVRGSAPPADDGGGNGKGGGKNK